MDGVISREEDVAQVGLLVMAVSSAVVLLLFLVIEQPAGRRNNRLGLSNTAWRRFLTGFLLLDLAWAVYLATTLF